MTFTIYPQVVFDSSCQFDPFCLIGVPFSEEVLPSLVLGKKGVFRSHTVLYLGSVFGDNCQTGHYVLVRQNCQIGNHVSIGSSSVIEHEVKIGEGVRIHSQAFIPEFSLIEEFAWIGPRVVFTNAKYPRSPNVRQSLQGPCIGKYAKIGANATILPGIHIGEHALVGAGSVVTKDVPAYAVVVGNPAKRIKSIQDLPYELENKYLYQSQGS